MAFTPPADFIPKAIAYRCNRSHKFKDVIRQGVITIPICPKCKKDGVQNRSAEVFILLASIDDSPDIPQEDTTPQPKVTMADKVALFAPFNGDAHALLLAVLTDAGVRMGDGRIGREMCKGCETGLHGPGIKKCLCACHAGWAYIEYIERRPASKAA